jgi:predicted GNAT family N-acyltransferase
MSNRPSFVIRPVNWAASYDELHAVRRAVFIEEQRVPEALEWDDADERSYHVLAMDDDGTPIGTGRLLPDGHIGRMAVLREWRGQGVGSAILRTLLELARKEGLQAIALNAQTHAVGFYARHGFTVFGDEFMDAGIPHRKMQMRLNPEEH